MIRGGLRLSLLHHVKPYAPIQVHLEPSGTEVIQTAMLLDTGTQLTILFSPAERDHQIQLFLPSQGFQSEASLGGQMLKNLPTM